MLDPKGTERRSTNFHGSDNWSIDNETFVYIEQNFDRFTVDGFAANNTKSPVFNSKYHRPDCASVNAFTTDCRLDFNWLCPPVKLVGKTLSHMRFCKLSRWVLFIPMWDSSFYWPLLTPDGKTFSHSEKVFWCWILGLSVTKSYVKRFSNLLLNSDH